MNSSLLIRLLVVIMASWAKVNTPQSIKRASKERREHYSTNNKKTKNTWK
jgi:hypothetical protein